MISMVRYNAPWSELVSTPFSHALSLSPTSSLTSLFFLSRSIIFFLSLIFSFEMYHPYFFLAFSYLPFLHSLSISSSHPPPCSLSLSLTISLSSRFFSCSPSPSLSLFLPYPSLSLSLSSSLYRPVHIHGKLSQEAADSDLLRFGQTFHRKYYWDWIELNSAFQGKGNVGAVWNMMISGINKQKMHFVKNWSMECNYEVQSI